MEGPLGDTDGTSSDMLTPPELAARWRMSVRTLDRWRAKKYGPAWLCLGGRILYRRVDVEAFEARRLRLRT
jgi:Helix-turn-helix domain